MARNSGNVPRRGAQWRTHRAVEYAGGQSEVARLMGVRPAAVHQWVAQNRIPAERMLAFAVLVEPVHTRWELRPDVYGGMRQNYEAIVERRVHEEAGR